MQQGYEETVSCFNGNIPVVLSAHHDGWLTSLDGNELPVLRDVGNDEGTRRLVWLVFRLMKQMYGMRPYTLVHKVKKDRSSEEMLTVYIEEIFSLIRHCLEKWGLCYIFDVHRFYKHPEFVGEMVQNNYDIWLGTGHRASIRGDFDKKFAASLSFAFEEHCGRKLGVYVPDEEERAGERFGATGKHGGRRIITKLISEEFRDRPINAVQIEFYKDLLAPDERIKSAIALSEAIAINI